MLALTDTNGYGIVELSKLRELAFLNLITRLERSKEFAVS